VQERFYQKRSTETGAPNPEARWWISLYGIWLMPLGLMISAWTSYAYLPWIAPLVSQYLDLLLSVFACVFGAETERIFRSASLAWDLGKLSEKRLCLIESHIRLFDTNSFFCIINAILTYVVDGYGHYASSALAGVVFVRNIVGAIFPLCKPQLLVPAGEPNSTV
jgi:hypothetical protein